MKNRLSTDGVLLPGEALGQVAFPDTSEIISHGTCLLVHPLVWLINSATAILRVLKFYLPFKRQSYFSTER